VTSTTVEGFSLSHAAILNGTTGAEEAAGDIYGVRTGTIAVDTGNYDNTGDDAVLSSWFWFNYATVTIQSGYMPFDTISLLSGSTITSLRFTGTNDYYSLPLWEETSLNQPVRPDARAAARPRTKTVLSEPSTSSSTRSSSARSASTARPTSRVCS
jgi:hypothetical protein